MAVVSDIIREAAGCVISVEGCSRVDFKTLVRTGVLCIGLLKVGTVAEGCSSDSTPAC